MIVCGVRVWDGFVGVVGYRDVRMDRCAFSRQHVLAFFERE